MNSKLIRRLQREAKANPAKAAALVIVIVVAIGFWTPLVIRWCSPSTAPAEEASATVATTGTATGTEIQPRVIATSQTPSVAPTGAPSASWQQIVQRIEQDPRMQPNRRLGQGRNPLGPSAAELAAAKVSHRKEIKRTPTPDLLPAEAGLVLNSTLIGSGRRMALIGGEPYWEGDTVPALRGSGRFKLIEVFARRVELERAGKHFDLEINSTTHDPSLAGDLVKARSESLHHDTAGSSNSAPRGGKASTNKRSNPFVKFNANE